MKKILVYSAFATIIFYLINNFFFTENELGLYSTGSISGHDIIAKFNFTVYKSKNQLNFDKKQAKNNTLFVYEILNSTNYKIVKNINSFFKNFTQDKTNFTKKYKNILTTKHINLLSNPKILQNCYELISNNLPDILNNGIIQNTLPDTLILKNKDKQKIVSNTQILKLKKAINLVSNKTKNKNVKHITKQILNIFLKQNIKFNKTLTAKLQNKNISNVSDILVKVPKNQVIVPKNHKITKTDFIKIKQYRNLLAKKSILFKPITVSKIMFSFFAFAIFSFFLIICNIISTRLLKKKTNIVILFLLFLLNYSNSSLIVYLNLNPYLNFFAFSLLLIVSLYSPAIMLAFIVSQLMLSSFLPVWLMLPFFASTLAVIICYSLYMHKRNNYDPIGLIFSIISFNALFMILLELSNASPISDIYTNLIYTIVSGIIASTLFLIVLPLLQKKLKIAAKQILLELLDFNNPLLKMLAKKAPGTYHHSINVGIIAENIAASIGCDPLLARVGSYYHDIGKLENSEFFIENNKNSALLHNKLEYTQSAALIKDHIAQGEFLAKKYSLPIPVINIIRQHHGTSTIKYFYLKAIEEYGKVDDTKFRYFGPKPQSKEAAIVMIGDIVESTASSLKKPDKKSLKLIINNTLKQLVAEGQLEYTDLTLKDLNIIKSSLLPVLEGIHHRRITYPNQKVK